MSSTSCSTWTDRYPTIRNERRLPPDIASEDLHSVQNRLGLSQKRGRGLVVRTGWKKRVVRQPSPIDPPGCPMPRSLAGNPSYSGVVGRDDGICPFRQTSWASGSHRGPKSQPSGAGSQASPSQLTFRLHFQAIPVMLDGGQITPVTPAMPTTEHRPRCTGAIRCAHLRAAMRIPPTLGPGDVSVVQSQAAGSTGDESPVY